MSFEIHSFSLQASPTSSFLAKSRSKAQSQSKSRRSFASSPPEMVGGHILTLDAKIRPPSFRCAMALAGQDALARLKLDD